MSVNSKKVKNTKLYSSLLLAVIVLISTSCAAQNPVKPKSVEPGMEWRHLVIDENFIATKDVQAIIEPVWFTANIYGSYSEYDASLKSFSYSQRLVYAAQWYDAEVNNGGHDQFYSNSTGIVWEDAQKAFLEMGLPEVAKIITESAKRMGGRPSFDRAERNSVIEWREPNFDDLDDQFYKLKNIDSKVLEYIRKRPKEFLFKGEVQLPVLR